MESYWYPDIGTTDFGQAIMTEPLQAFSSFDASPLYWHYNYMEIMLVKAVRI